VDVGLLLETTPCFTTTRCSPAIFALPYSYRRLLLATILFPMDACLFEQNNKIQINCHRAILRRCIDAYSVEMLVTRFAIHEVGLGYAGTESSNTTPLLPAMIFNACIFESSEVHADPERRSINPCGPISPKGILPEEAAALQRAKPIAHGVKQIPCMRAFRECIPRPQTFSAPALRDEPMATMFPDLPFSCGCKSDAKL
jgi:hypothetical protein